MRNNVQNLVRSPNAQWYQKGCTQDVDPAEWGKKNSVAFNNTTKKIRE